MNSDGFPKERRLFVALPVPAELGSQAGKLPRKGLTDARWNHPDDLHITLRFLGDVEEDRIPAVEEALARVRRPVFGVEVRGMGFFEKRHGAILWLAVQSTRKMTALTADINEAVEPLGFEMPRIPYVPHVTLARLKKRHGLDSYIKQHGRKISHSWQADRFGLYLSAPADEKGRHYSALQNFTLNS